MISATGRVTSASFRNHLGTKIVVGNDTDMLTRIVFNENRTAAAGPASALAAVCMESDSEQERRSL
jgi:hypothetical protein